MARFPLSDTVFADVIKPGLRATAVPDYSVTEVRGRAEVLTRAPLLADLAESCGQLGFVDQLAFRLSDPYFGSKLPSLFLFSSPAATARTHAPLAAVLLHEYRVLGLRTGIYVPADLAGDWTVLAPAGLQAEIVQQTALHLRRRGAPVALLTVNGSLAPLTRASRPGDFSNSRNPESTKPGNSTEPGSPGNPSESFAPPVATAERPLLRTLSLRATLDATLSTMGAHTRRNLRLARRQAEGRLGARFEPRAELSEDEFLALNHDGFYPVPDHVARWRYRSAHGNTGGFMAGVRAAGGDWLALLGGRRFLAGKGSCTAVDWQWNRMSFSRFSPGSLMRILLIEQEQARGTTQLRFEGGTPHSMRSAFDHECVSDLLYASPRLPRSCLRLLGRVLPKGNLLGDLLTSPHLVWRQTAP